MNADQTGPVTVEARGTLPKQGLWDTAIDMEVVYEFENCGLDDDLGAAGRKDPVL